VDLDRLIATEQRLDEKLRRAHEEATRLVEDAQAAARTCEARVTAELEAAAQRFATETAAERERREREVKEAAAATVKRYERVSGERVAQAARDVVERLVAGEESAA
jgi:vacuolar-type H+-ATPase subunit H